MNAKKQNVWLPGQVNPRLAVPRNVGPVRLDLLADLELQHGHTNAAEFLSHRAAELRETRGLREARP